MMKKRTTIAQLASLITVFLLAAFLCACGGSKAPEQSAPETTAAPESEAAEDSPELSDKSQQAMLGFLTGGSAAEELPVEGSYTLFGVINEGYMVDSASMEMESFIKLEDGGKGAMSFDGDDTTIPEWTLNDDKISITVADGSSTDGIVRNGVIELDIYGDGSLILCYAQEGADLSAYELLSIEDLVAEIDKDSDGIPDIKGNGSKVADVWNNLNNSKGIHLHYDAYMEGLDVQQEYDVHVLGGKYYSLRKMEIGAHTSELITYIDDGKVYNLYPDDMTGILVTETSAGIILSHPELTDQLIQDIFVCMQNSVYDEETMDISGEDYDAEVYPASSMQSEGIFCFDRDGKLAFYLKSEDPESDTPGITDGVFTIHEFDDKVDVSLFDISGYTIE